MKRILKMLLIFILLNIIITCDILNSDIEKLNQNIQLNTEEEVEVVENTIIKESLQNNNINTINILDYNEDKSQEDTVATLRGDSKDYIPTQAIVTAYAPYDNKSGICNDGTPDTTATGTKPKFGTLAADPKRIPYGTEIYIEGYGFGVVEDTGSALRKDKDDIRIDVFMETYEEAMEWGRQEMIIYIVK